MDGKTRTLISHGLLLLAIGSAMFLTRLSGPLREPEETRYAEIPRQMLAEGRFVEPVLHGQPYYQKPPLMYWLVMGAYRVFGVHDWAARLVPALASLATVLVTWLWGRSVFGSRTGLAAALVLLLSARFVYLGRMLTIDPLLCLWVTTALASAHLAVRQTPLRRGWWLASALLTGLGLLTKGPVALVLVLVPAIAFQVLDRRRARPSLISLAGYLIVAVAVAGPWFVAMTVKNPDAAGDFFWLHNVQRYLDPVDHEEPVWFFLPSLLGGTLPWSLLLIPLINWLARRRPRVFAAGPGGLGFALLALGWCVLFFSMSGCKRAVYILPALPWLSICLGFCCRSAVWHALAWRPSRWMTRAMAGVVFGVLLAGVYLLLPSDQRRFALRGQVRRHLGTETEVFCYPKRWDGVTFYLQRTDVHVFTTEQRSEFIAALQKLPEALLFVKRPALAELMSELPPSLELVPVGRQGATVTVLASRQRKLAEP